MFGNLGWAASIPAVTGSRSANAALSSLLTQLQAMGIVTNQTGQGRRDQRTQHDQQEPHNDVVAQWRTAVAS